MHLTLDFGNILAVVENQPNKSKFKQDLLQLQTMTESYNKGYICLCSQESDIILM